ncbi:hypothetical protein [Shewanella sp. Isolate11]|uniref:hypothetical protein n=1 Tax=Shewanella sp. Isolate11 TaxID=2908530 RepID=UPI001EFEF103|nr:hypothetical protein [Shewanella sp. Isolate11]MCG9697545.1 hypothetical protein [Shewanella sp. Isolate11]
MKQFLPLLSLLVLLPACSGMQPYHDNGTETRISPDTGQEEDVGYIAVGVKSEENEKVDLNFPKKEKPKDKGN